MKYFDWDSAKNDKLSAERGISFEDILVALAEERVLDVMGHPNPKKYGGQKILIMEIDGYAYLVPFVEDEEKYFLKTIIPSRKMTKLYIIERNNI